MCCKVFLVFHKKIVFVFMMMKFNIKPLVSVKMGKFEQFYLHK